MTVELPLHQRVHNPISRSSSERMPRVRVPEDRQIEYEKKLREARAEAKATARLGGAAVREGDQDRADRVREGRSAEQILR